MRRLVLSVSLAALVACDAPPGDGSTAPPRPNLILISVDTLRADHLGCYGYPRPTSPFIDALARDGVRFENAFAQTSWTLPSHMSLLTSRHPHSHAVQTDRDRLPDSVTPLAAVLQRHGYHTAAFVTWVYVGAKFGFGRGFSEFHELVPPPEQIDVGSRHATRAEELVDRVLAWLGTRPPEPFFLFVHFFDPHLDYAPPLEHARVFDPEVTDLEHGTYEFLKPSIRGLNPEPKPLLAEEVARVRALYDGEIRYVDHELARLFGAPAASALSDALVVFTSDHGEEFQEHGSMEGHGWTLYDEVTHVPLVVRLPGREHAGTEIDALVQSIDVAPTLLDFLGLEPPAGFEGRSLLPTIHGENVSPDAEGRFALATLQRFNVRAAIRTRRHKLIFTDDTGTNVFGVPVVPGFELYDLERDPGEQRNVYDPSQPVARSLAQQMAERLSASKRAERAPAPELTEEERARLRALGYVDR